MEFYTRLWAPEAVSKQKVTSAAKKNVDCSTPCLSFTYALSDMCLYILFQPSRLRNRQNVDFANDQS